MIDHRYYTAEEMDFISRRAERLFEMMRTLNSLIDQMDDVEHLKAARDLITSRWEDENSIIKNWWGQFDKATSEGDET